MTLPISPTLLQLLLVGGLVLLHLFAGRLRFLHVVPRSRWLSTAGGASVAYVFLHLLPELAQAQSQIARLHHHALVEQGVYVLALIGLVTFYGLERAIKCSKQAQEQASDRQAMRFPQVGLFWLHISSFVVYNTIVGYLLVHGERDTAQQLLFFIAMALHFLVVDYGLRDDHNETYDHTARWVLAAAIVSGWLVGTVSGGSEIVIHLLYAFIAGAVVLNVMKEELPKEREARFTAFATGAGAYTALLLLL